MADHVKIVVDTDGLADVFVNGTLAAVNLEEEDVERIVDISRDHLGARVEIIDNQQDDLADLQYGRIDNAEYGTAPWPE